MIAQKQVYRCDICGNIVEVLHAGKGKLECCKELMRLLEEKVTDVGQEKHVPVVELTDGVTKVKVGEVPHPMEMEHYIEWVEVLDGDKVCRQFLKPGSRPEAEFNAGGQKVIAREYCNIHGLWKSG